MNCSLLEHFGTHAHILRKSSHMHWGAPTTSFATCPGCVINVPAVKCSFAAVSINSNMMLLLSHKAYSAVENGD